MLLQVEVFLNTVHSDELVLLHNNSAEEIFFTCKDKIFPFFQATFNFGVENDGESSFRSSEYTCAGLKCGWALLCISMCDGILQNNTIIQHR